MVEYHINYETDEDIVIKKYSQKNINIVHRELKINHDGFDRNGGGVDLMIIISIIE
jgi:hypothetical protein